MVSEYAYNNYREKYLNAVDLNLKLPVDISLELASFCNQHCVYCYHADKKNMPFKQKNMSWATISKILFQGAKFGVKSVKLNWRGESTMNPYFYRACRMAKLLSETHLGSYIDRISNSNFKFDSNNEEIFQGFCYQTKVKVSYDSFRKEVFEKQRAGGNHDITTANIDKFYNYRGRNNLLVIQAVRTQLNKDEDFESEIKKRWPSALLSVRDVVEGRLEKNIDHLTVKDRSKDRQSCIQAHARLIFSAEGTASPCCPDIAQKLAIGNINDMNLEDIFNSPKAKTLRKDLKSKKAFDDSPCKNCSSHETFKGYKPSWDS